MKVCHELHYLKLLTLDLELFGVRLYFLELFEVVLFVYFSLFLSVFAHPSAICENYMQRVKFST